MATRGFRVFPLLPGTKIPPKGFAWKTLATKDAETIRTWAAEHPGCNFGVACGAGLIVIDLDLKSGVDGPASLAALEAEHGRIPETLIVQTPSGGRHLYFVGPDVANSAGKLGAGIDVRGMGGYVVGPGSSIDGKPKPYCVSGCVEIAEAPVWLILMAGAPRAKEDGGPVSVDDPRDVDYAIRYLQNEAPEAVSGSRNDTAFKVAARLIEIGVSAKLAGDLMLENWNEQKCDPPLDPGEITATAEHAETYAQNRQGSGGVAAAAEAFCDAVPLEGSDPRPAEPPLMWASDLFHLPEPDWLVEDLLPEGGVGLLAGQSRIGKSFIALELARCVMTGEPFFGHEVSQRGGVLIAAAEAPETLSGRIKALCNEAHPNGRLNPARLPLVVVPLTGREQLPRLVARTAAAMRAKSVQLRLVIVDTIAAGYRVADENDAGQATEAMQHLADGARAFGGFMLGVHHFGKNGASGARGSSAWTASADIILAATGVVDDETGNARDRKLALTKSRNARTKLLSHFEIVDVLTGVRRNGKEARAGLVRLLESNPAQAASRPPKWLEALLDAFDQVEESQTIRLGGQACIPQTYAREIFDNRVRPEFPSASSCRNAWARALKFALEKGHLRVADGVPHAFILGRRSSSDEE